MAFTGLYSLTLVLYLWIAFDPVLAQGGGDSNPFGYDYFRVMGGFVHWVKWNLPFNFKASSNWLELIDRSLPYVESLINSPISFFAPFSFIFCHIFFDCCSFFPQFFWPFLGFLSTFLHLLLRIFGLFLQPFSFIFPLFFPFHLKFFAILALHIFPFIFFIVVFIFDPLHSIF